MRIAYADPPYPGMAKKHYSHDEKCAEVDHKELIEHLETFDGWALSSGANLSALQYVVPLLPEGVRVCCWVKPFCSFKKNVTFAYAWEPVFIKPVRKIPSTEPTCRDWVAANITLKRGLSGAKPHDFCKWMFTALGAKEDDEFIDLYPGSGAVQRAWDIFSKTAEQPTMFADYQDLLSSGKA